MLPLVLPRVAETPVVLGETAGLLNDGASMGDFLVSAGSGFRSLGSTGLGDGIVEVVFERRVLGGDGRDAG